MKKGNFKSFVDLISPLKKTYYDFSVYVQLFIHPKPNEDKRSNDPLPLYDIETNERDENEICFMVRGLSEDKNTEKNIPLNVGSFIEKIIAIKEICKDHIIVLAQKDIDYRESDEDGDKGDYISYHAPIKEIKTSSNDGKKVFYLEILLFDDKTEHVHYGNIYDPDSGGIIYKNVQNSKT